MGLSQGVMENLNFGGLGGRLTTEKGETHQKKPDQGEVCKVSFAKVKQQAECAKERTRFKCVEI